MSGQRSRDRLFEGALGHERHLLEQAEEVPVVVGLDNLPMPYLDEPHAGQLEDLVLPRHPELAQATNRPSAPFCHLCKDLDVGLCKQIAELSVEGLERVAPSDFLSEDAVGYPVVSEQLVNRCNVSLAPNSA